MLYDGTLDGWEILKEFVTGGPDFQSSSFRFALRRHPNLMQRPDCAKLRDHYGQLMQSRAARGHLNRNGRGDYSLSSEGRDALIGHQTEERESRRKSRVDFIQAFAAFIGAFAAMIGALAAIISLCMK